jgi:hypothetical protein
LPLKPKSSLPLIFINYLNIFTSACDELVTSRISCKIRLTALALGLVSNETEQISSVESNYYI